MTPETVVNGQPTASGVRVAGQSEVTKPDPWDVFLPTLKAHLKESGYPTIGADALSALQEYHGIRLSARNGEADLHEELSRFMLEQGENLDLDEVQCGMEYMRDNVNLL